MQIKVHEIMSQSPDFSFPHDSLQEVASKMLEQNTGIIPIGENDKLIGMITDRDIAIRAVAEGMGPEAKVQDIMTGKVLYCFASDDIEDVIENMKEENVHRLIVLNNQEQKRLAGMISVSDIARKCSEFARIDEAFTECVGRDTKTAYAA